MTARRQITGAERAVKAAINDHATELDALQADVTALRTTVAALVVDVTALDAAIDTLIAKLNLDSGVNDADYAGAAAMTATAPDAITAAGSNDTLLS